MKVCIYGCGAIGLDLAVQLIKGGHAVTLIAKGETFKLLHDHGIEHIAQDGERTKITPDSYSVHETNTCRDSQDLIFLTVKADTLTTIAHDINPLLADDTIVVSATNGIPPWYSYQQDETIGRYLTNTSVREKFLEQVPARHIVGATVGRSASRSAPNAVSQTFGSGYVIGEPNHHMSERLHRLSEMLGGCGLTARMSDNIHRDIWLKLLGNVCVNPMSVLRECNIGELLSDQDTKQEMLDITREAELVGIKLGVIMPGDFNIERLVDFAKLNLAHHEPSMLQDFRRGAALEVHRIVEVVIMLSEEPGVDVPVDKLRSTHKRLLQKLETRDASRGSYA
ncbi:MAG: 2-dehydropantoate 2-reductase [Candidatus Obscuribacterales bacterium]|nr:2-dehydropantoate 2-reductase [Candidatus Obscuribacterales bacterium]